MHSEEGKYQVQLNAGSHGGHLHADWRGKGKGWNSRSISDVSTGHIFSLDF